MADSKRQQIVNAIKARLEGISTGASYETNLGASVHEWRDTALQESECPGAIFRDTVDPEELTFGEHVHTLALEVELFALGADAPTTLRKMIADVVKAFGTDRKLGGLAQDMMHRADLLATERESRRLAGAVVRFDVIYTTGQFDPYT